MDAGVAGAFTATEAPLVSKSYSVLRSGAPSALVKETLYTCPPCAKPGTVKVSQPRKLLLREPKLKLPRDQPKACSLGLKLCWIEGDGKGELARNCGACVSAGPPFWGVTSARNWRPDSVAPSVSFT